MKIVVVYSGEPRSFTKVQEQHKEFFEGVGYDTYHSTWIKTSEEDKKIIYRSPNVKGVTFVDYDASDRADLVRFEKTLLTMKRNHPIFMLGRIQYMTGQALKPLSWYKLLGYDYIVRMRYDFEYEGKFTDLLPKIVKDNDIFTTRKMGGKSSPINVWDGFAFGKPYAMSLYFDFNKWIPFSLFNKDIQEWKYQPEFVYGTYLRHVGLNVRDCEVQPHHVYWNDMSVDDHRATRTVQYYRDLYNFHPEWYYVKDNKLIIENDSPTVSDAYIINELSKEGIKVGKIQ